MNTTLNERLLSHALIATLFMCCAAALAQWLTPTVQMAALQGALRLEAVVPKAFGGWRIETATPAVVVNPQQQALLDQLYSQLLIRTYINSDGQRIMLSIAYGKDQRDGSQLHYPEVCYPAQGFQIMSSHPATLLIGQHRIPVRRLETSLQQQRFEPVTYWTTIGETAVRGGVDKKLAELRYGLRGVVPDGLLFRVSSIDRDSEKAFEHQSKFAQDLLTQVDPKVRKRLAGF